MKKLEIRDVVKYNIHQCSSRIKEIKESLKKQGRYISPHEGKLWSQYTGLKFQCTKWLGVLSFLKIQSMLSGVPLKKKPVQPLGKEHMPKNYLLENWLNFVVIPMYKKLEEEQQNGKLETKYKFAVSDHLFNKENNNA